MSHKKSKKNSQETKHNKSYQGYNQNQQENSSFDNELVSDKYQNNSNAQA